VRFLEIPLRTTGLGHTVTAVCHGRTAANLG